MSPAIAGTCTAVAGVAGAQLTPDTPYMLTFTNTFPTALRAAMFELPSMTTEDFNESMIDGKCIDMLPDGPNCVLTIIVRRSPGDGSLSTARCKQMAKVPRLRGKPGRSVLLTWAIMRFPSASTVRNCCPLVSVCTSVLLCARMGVNCRATES